MPKEQDTKENKSSISGATSYQEMGEFWDEHSLNDYWDMTEPVKFKVNLEAEEFYYKLDTSLADRINLLAQKKGINPEDLINSWVREKLQSNP
jgi:hypothetical protein